MSETNHSVFHRGPVAWMANNPVASNLLMFVLLAGGVISVSRIKQEVFPDFELDRVRVSVPYPGASPEEVEQGIVLAIEEAVRGIDGVDEISSSAQEGVGVVNIDLLLGADGQKVYQEVQQEVARIRTFPEEAEEPSVVLAARRREVISLVLYGDQTEAVLRELADQIRDRLLQDPGITQVDLDNVRPMEISISISQDRLREFGLTLDDVARTVRASALELPGGGVKTRGGEILLRVKDRRDYALQFGNIPILTAADGTPVRLGDVAEIRDDFEDVDRFATYNGKPAVSIEVYRVGKETPIGVADAVMKKLEEFRPTLPPGVELGLLRDLSDIYRQRAHLLLKNGAIGLSLVYILLSVFLHGRLAFWVMMGIPISFLGGLLLLPLFGVSINMISMFAFIIALGIVVDDAIVVGENVYEHHQRGMPFLRAAVAGARQVSIPVTFSVLTNIVTFLPLMFVPGFIGKIWRVIPAVVITVFAISLVESLFVLPAHLGHGGDRKRRGFSAWLHGRQQCFSHRFSSGVERYYRPVLEWVLRRRYLTVAAAIGALILTVGFVRSRRIGMIPMPRVESDYAIVTAALPYGSPVTATMAARDRLEAAARRVIDANGGDRLAIGILSRIGVSFRGNAGGHAVEVRIYLTSPELRPIGTKRVTELWRQETGRLVGVETLLFESDRGGPGSGASITVELAHARSEILQRASEELAEVLGGFPVVSDIDDGYTPGKAQLDFSMRPDALGLGLTAAETGRQVRNAFYGAEALRQQRGRHEVKVKVRLPPEERVAEHDVEELMLRTPGGRDVPLREMTRVRRGRAYTGIDRRNGRRTVTVSANATPPQVAEIVLADLKQDALVRLRQKYPGLAVSFEGRQAEFRESVRSLLLGFVYAMFAIYALLAIPFRSYAQPLIIMVSIPFGIVGAVIGHVIMGYSLSLISVMGIVALSGVVVNDSLVMIDFANGERRAGKSAHDAIVSAGVRRFRPILLTTFTTFGGLAPMIFETSRQARFMIPMAISLGYGIIFSTLITLVLVPSLYRIIEDVQGLFRARPRAQGGQRGTAG